MHERPKIKILIIGENSNLSKHFQNKFKSNKYLELIIVGRSKGYDHKNGGKKIKSLISLLKPSFVLNFFALASHKDCNNNPILAEKINSKFPYNIGNFCNNMNILFIHFSSDSVYNGRVNKLHEVKDIARPNTILGKTKLKGDNLIIKLPKAVIFRMPALYGKFFKSGFIYESKLNIKNKKIFYLCDDIFCTPFSADKIVSYLYKNIIIGNNKNYFIKKKIIQFSNNRRYSRYSYCKMTNNSKYLKKNSYKDLNLKYMPDQFMGLKNNSE